MCIPYYPNKKIPHFFWERECRIIPAHLIKKKKKSCSISRQLLSLGSSGSVTGSLFNYFMGYCEDVERSLTNRRWKFINLRVNLTFLSLSLSLFVRCKLEKLGYARFEDRFRSVFADRRRKLTFEWNLLSA